MLLQVLQNQSCLVCDVGVGEVGSVPAGLCAVEPVLPSGAGQLQQGFPPAWLAVVVVSKE